ncbi:MAG: adenine phosphoribosyltransferase [Planctomycetota bacterium]|jgi:adenine phosphoribosyltransferase|nr:adenine phosphoribosyltransferase [Planctomycetota bacterium]
MDLDSLIRDIPDFPKPGITFKDITPLLGDPRGLAVVVDRMAEPFIGQGITKVVGIESRGFIFAPAVALRLDCGFVPVRKPGKLPWDCEKVEYDLEYGTDALEIHKDAVTSKDKVLIVDDVLATGGTALAALELVRRLGAQVAACCFIVELETLGGRKRIDCECGSILTY